MPEDGALRERLALALDMSDLERARRLARRLAPYFAVAKIGLELFSAAGPAALEAFAELGYRVFLDVKLHDIPTTVGRAARVIGRLGPSYLTVHTRGGEAMLRAAVEGFAEGAAESAVAIDGPGQRAVRDAPGGDPSAVAARDLAVGDRGPIVLGVTVLTSDPVASSVELARLASRASAAGCGGVVCAASDLEIVRSSAPGLLLVVPGIRPAGSARHDQARTATPAEAFAAGAGLLVVGRAVTAAEDPEAVAAAIAGG